MASNKYTQDLNKLRKWLSARKWTLEFAKKLNEADLIDNIVYLDPSLSKETRIYILLHECGHVLVFDNKQYHKKFPYLNKHFFNMKPKRKETASFITEQLIEEMEAWQSGKRLAKRLNIKINEKKFHKRMIKSLYSYIDQ